MKKMSIVSGLTAGLLAGVPAVWADGLPVDILSKGGLNDSTLNGNQVVVPFITIMNSVIGILAAILLAYAIFHLVLKVKDLISGKKNFKSMCTDFISLGIAVVVLAISIGGGWYSLINWIYVNIIQKVLGSFN